MISISLSDSKRPLRSFICYMATICFGVLAAPAQQQDQLQQQLQELKDQYAKTTRDLEQRIAALEQQIEKQKDTNTNKNESALLIVRQATQQAAERAVLEQSDQVGAKF